MDQIEKHDSLVYSGSALPWHRKGQQIERGTERDAMHQLRVIGGDFADELLPVYCELTTGGTPEGLSMSPDGEFVTIPAVAGSVRRVPIDGKFAHTRTSGPGAGIVYGIVGKVYARIAHRQAVAMMQAMLDLTPAAQVTSLLTMNNGLSLAGSIGYGVDGEWDANAGTGRPGDVMVNYTSVLNAHGGTGRFRGWHGAIRPICANTVAQGLAMATDSISFKHTAGASGDPMTIKMAQATALLTRGATVLAGMRDRVQALARREVDSAGTKALLERLWLDGFGQRPKEADATPRILARYDTLRTDTLAMWNRNIEDDRQNAIRGSAWGVLNAVTQWYDHQQGGAKVSAEDRTTGSQFGKAAEAKERAMALCLAE